MKDRSPSPSSTENLDENRIAQAAAGDQSAIEALVLGTSPVLQAQARMRIGSDLGASFDPADLVQEAWLIALPRLGALVDRHGPRLPVLLRYLGSIILNRANYHLRRSFRGGTPSMLDAETVVEAGAPSNAGLAALVDRESCERLLSALEKLSEDERRVVELRGFESWTNAECAEILGLDGNVVAQRWRRARERLREDLGRTLLDQIED